MACEIQERDGFFEVRVRGATSKDELLATVRELHRRDPGKKLPDLWIIAPESQVPFVAYIEIAKQVQGLCTPGMAGNRTAIVAEGELQKAQLELYRSEASILPWEIRVFGCPSEAARWLRGAGAADRVEEPCASLA